MFSAFGHRDLAKQVTLKVRLSGILNTLPNTAFLTAWPWWRLSSCDLVMKLTGFWVWHSPTIYIIERAGVPSLSYCHWSIYFFSPPMRRLYSLLCWVNFQLLILWTRTIWNQYLYQQQWIPEAALAKMLCSFKNTIDAIPIDKYYFRGSWCEQDKWYMKSIRGREIFQD